MSVAYDAGGITDMDSTVNDYDVDITPGSGSDMVLVCFAGTSRGGKSVTSMVYDSGGADEATLTEQASVEGPNTDNREIQCGTLVDSQIVKSTLKSITINHSSGSKGSARVATFTGVDQTTPFGTFNTAEDETHTDMTTQSITTTSGDMAVDGIINDVTPTVGSGQTALGGAPNNPGNKGHGASYEAASGSSVDMDWSWSGSREWSWIGVCINQASAGGGETGTITDSTGVSDTFGAAATALASMSDSVAISDTLSSILVIYALMTDSLTVSDTESAQATAVASAIESLTVSDVKSAVATALATVAESINISDTLISQATALATMSDSATLSETLTSVILIIADIAESLTVSDTIAAQATAVASLLESTSVNDVVTGLATALADISEAVDVDDTQAGGLILLASLAESINLSDTYSATIETIVLPTGFVKATINIYAKVNSDPTSKPVVDATPEGKPLVSGTIYFGEDT